VSSKNKEDRRELERPEKGSFITGVPGKGLMLKDQGRLLALACPHSRTNKNGTKNDSLRKRPSRQVVKLLEERGGKKRNFDREIFFFKSLKG